MMPTTDPTGKSFLSYRRSRLGEAKLLIEAQHDIGVPTWQDISDLDELHTDEKLLAVLADSTTANAIAWLTPDIASSPTMTETELPGILRRVERKDDFFLIPVAAGGLDYGDVAKVVGTYLGVHDLGQWNLRKVAGDPIEEVDAATIANRVLTRRLEALHRQLPKGDPIRLLIHTRTKPPSGTGVGILLDWVHRFNGREAIPAAWDRYLLPAVKAVAQACEVHAPGRVIAAEGLCALPAAVALGVTFIGPRRLPISWLQVHPKRGPQTWSLDLGRQPCGFIADIQAGSPGASDLAVLVSVASNVEPAFGASRPDLPSFRGLVIVKSPGSYPHDIETPGQAVDLIQIILEGLKRARDTFQPRGAVHLFLAVPAGLAMMLGQCLNSLGAVQTYEHVPTDAVGIYRRAALLRP
jgi:hypothetical protein